MPVGKAKRKAWDETIKAVAIASGASAASIAPGKKRETRRRVNARRWLYTGAGDTEELKLRVEARLEALQESHYAEPADAADDDDAYEDLDEDEKKPAAKRAKKAAGSKRGAGAGAAPGAALVVAKSRLRARPLGQQLLDEDAAARAREYFAAEAPRPRAPARKLCSVSGVAARYRDGASGLTFATVAAGRAMRDQPPPWATISLVPSTYYDARRAIVPPR